MGEQRHGSARLLVVDDNKVNRLLLARSLELQGHRIASAENGRIALEMLRREPFDLLLLDMEMPEMDGFQVLEQLVNDRKLRDLPVIITSSLEGIANVVRCIELGARCFLERIEGRAIDRRCAHHWSLRADTWFSASTSCSTRIGFVT